MSSINRRMFLIMGIITSIPVYAVWGGRFLVFTYVAWFIAYRVTDSICDVIKGA